MVQRRQRERSLFEVLLPDGHRLWPDWLRTIDTLLEDEAVTEVVAQALERRWPQSRRRGRRGTPAEVVIRMLILKHLFDCIPGVSTLVRSGVKAPSTNEISVGVANQIGKGTWRVDYVRRKSIDMYGDFLDRTTGRVADPAGRLFDLTLVSNTPTAARSYDGLTGAVSYRFPRLQVGANYTLAKTWGNNNGENVGAGPTRATFDTYPEYRQASWDYPMGYNPGDERHKVRACFFHTLPAPQAIGQFDVGLVQRYDSPISDQRDVSGLVDSRPYVTNPGYLNPIANVAYYYVSRGSVRWDPVWTTDLSLTWAKKISHGHTSELFVRGVLTNIFNNAALVSGDTAINSRVNDTTLQAFNPFTTVPVQGVNWKYGPNFGTAQATTDYQPSRLFTVSAGLRF